MSWLARLSLGAAIRWALVWPVTVVAVLSVLVMMNRSMDFAVNLQTYPHVPWWVPLVVFSLVLLFAPPVLFLGAWIIARRSGS